MLVEKSSSRVPIRRSQFQGVLVQLSLSDHMTSLEAKINAVQVRLSVCVCVCVCVHANVRACMRGCFAAIKQTYTR